MDLFSRARALVAACFAVAVIFGAALPASAQQAGRALDDPTGQAPVQPRPIPEPSDTAPSDTAPSDAAPSDAARSDAAPPAPTGYDAPGVPEVVPPPPGGYPVEPGAPSVGLQTRARLRALDVTWQSLGMRGGPNWFGGIVGILGGGLQIGIGAFLLDVGDPAAEYIAPYFITLGVTTAVRATLVDLILAPDPRPVAARYAAMPAGTPEEAEARLAFGERELEALAEYSMWIRVLDASLSIAGALAVIPAYLVPRDWMIEHELEALVFLGPAFSVIFAIVTLASPSPAEQRWGAYRQMRDRLDEGSGISFTPGFSIDPNGNGGFATLSARF